jgi:hypothetical protein
MMVIFCYELDHVEPKTGIQVQQVQGVFRRPQASSCEDANIVVTKASPDAYNHIRWVLCIFYLTLWFLLVH